MTSTSSFPQRLTKIDGLTLGDHSHLNADDDCYFLGEYTAREGYAFSATNDLISNFKKDLGKKGKPEWRYKDEAIKDTAVAFRMALGDTSLETWTFVPIPPSKAKSDPFYDDRLTRMLLGIRPKLPLDVRELVVQTENTEPAHSAEVRPTPDAIKALYAIDEGLAVPPPMDSIALVDDVLTTGAHFRAAKSILAQRFPTARIIGLFIARRVPATLEIELDDLLKF